MQIVEILSRTFVLALIAIIMHCDTYGLVDRMSSAKMYNVFISSISTKGDMSDFRVAYPTCNFTDGIAVADCVCTKLASTAGMHTVTGTQFRAALSSSSSHGFCHILGMSGDLTQDSDGNYAECAGVAPADFQLFAHWQAQASYSSLVFPSWMELANNSLTLSSLSTFPIATDGRQEYIGDVWTGGNTGDGNCTDWSDGTSAGSGVTGQMPAPAELSYWYRNTNTTSCNNVLPIYCFEEPL